MNAPGYNPMRWRCEDRGCYNIKHRPKIEVFAECLPGKIAFTDVDASTEVNGRFLFLEWKGEGVRDIPTGQRIYLERLTRLSPAIQAVIVSGDPESMTCRAIKVACHGRISDWQICTLDALKGRIRSWATRAKAAPHHSATPQDRAA